MLVKCKKTMQKILDFIYHVYSYFIEESNINDKNILKNKSIVLSPDGTWSLKDNNCFSEKKIKHKDDDQVGKILEPPSFFSKKRELSMDLNECYIKGFIDSCTHILCENGAYILKLSICPKSSSPENLKRLRKWMEKGYDFKTIQQDRAICPTTNQNYYTIAFEYDPKKLIFK